MIFKIFLFWAKFLWLHYYFSIFKAKFQLFPFLSMEEFAVTENGNFIFILSGQYLANLANPYSSRDNDTLYAGVLFVEVILLLCLLNECLTYSYVVVQGLNYPLQFIAF